MKKPCTAIFLSFLGFKVLLAQSFLNAPLNEESTLSHKIIIKTYDERSLSEFLYRRQNSFPFKVDETKQLHPSKAKASSKKKLVNKRRRSENISKYGINRIYEITLEESDVSEALKWLQQQEWVEYAEPVYKNHSLNTPVKKSSNTSKLRKPTAFNWSYTRAEIDYAWNTEGVTGKGVIVGVIDTGTDTDHPALIGKLYENDLEKNGSVGIDDDGNGYIDDINGYNFISNNGNINPVSGHGTEVAGFVVAANDLPSGSRAFGTAPDSKVLTLQVGNNYLNTVPAMLYAAEQGAKIINLSYGRVGFPSWYEQDMINYLTETYDVVFVAAAGNDGKNWVRYPASYDNVLSVTHTGSSDQGVGSTTYNYFVDVTAPGSGTSFITNGGGFDNTIAVGSSYAAPFVAGIAALLIEKYPTLTAQQISELIRTTADENYGFWPNNTVPFKLGKGRVNARRALTEKDSKPAIRMSNFTFSSTAGRHILFGGQGLTLSCDFTNYLAPSSSNLQVTLSLSEDSPNCNTTNPDIACTNGVSITSGTVNIGTLNTLESTTRDFTVDINTSEYWKRVQFKLTITDTGTGYTDYQYFEVYIRPSLTYKINRFSVGMNTDGRLGNTGTLSNPVTGGLFFDNLSNPLGNSGRTHAPLIKRAGLIIANQDGSKVMDAAPFSYTTGDPVSYTAENDDFASLKDMRIYDFDNNGISFQGTFDDVGRYPSGGAIGVEIDHKIYGYYFSTDLDYLVIEYNVENKSGADFDSLHAGLFIDWDLHGLTQPSPWFNPLPYQANQVKWNETEKFGYVYNSSAGQYVGVHILNPNRSYYALDLKAANIGDNGVDIDPLTSGFSNAEKYQALANRIAKKEVTVGSDVAQVIGTTLYNIPNGEEQNMTMVVFFSPDEAGLTTVKNKALARISSNYRKGVLPIVDLISCPAATVLRPQAEGTYNFYKPTNLIEAVYTGREYTVPPSDLGTTYHITNVNETLESDAVIISTSATPTALPVANFTAPATVNRSINPLVSFTDASTNATTWEWSFGDGSPIENTASPTHEFKKQGSYNITLTVNKDTPCEVSIAKSVIIQSESPTPIFTSPILVCKNEGTTISPTGGSNFKFYDALPPSGTLLFSGTEYVISKVASDLEIFVINTDSLIESNALEVQVNTKALPTAEFTISSERRINNDISFTPNETGLTSTNWDFGDGNSSTITSPTHQYSNTGNYTVTLIATNALGCSFTETQEITIIPEVSPPSLTPLSICSGNSAIIKPEPNNGIFRFYSALPTSPTNLLFEGTEYTTPNLLTDQTFYVTQLIDGNESVSKSADVKVLLNPTVDFTAPTDINRSQNEVVNFSSIHSNDVVTWKWNFGDGSPEVFMKDPQHNFNKQGDFQITLEVENASGCTSLIQKQITVKSESPLPIVEAISPVCPKNNVTITPINGTNYRFYDDVDLASLLFEGRSFTITQFSAPATVYIVNIDSAIYSSPLRVDIPLNPINAEFETEPEMSLLENGSILVNFKAIQNGDIYKWNINGKLASTNSKHYSYSFPTEGNYNVLLEVTDATGCSVVREKPILVKATQQVIKSGEVPKTTTLPTFIPPGGNPITTAPFLQLGNDLIIEKNASLTLPNNSTLLVEGNTIVKGKLIQGENAKIILKGNLKIEEGELISTTDQFLSISFQNTVPVEISNQNLTSLQNLELEGVDVSLASHLMIYNTLTLNQGNLITSDLFGVTLRSTQKNAAILVNSGSGNVIGSNFNIERYIPNNSLLDGIQVYNGLRYHYLASPVKDLPISELDDRIVTGSFQLKIDPFWNAQNGQEIPFRLFPNTFEYQEKYVAEQNNDIMAGWRVPERSSTMTLGKGYAVRVLAGTTFTFKGKPNNGSISLPISRTEVQTEEQENTGWALIGNPYPSPISTTSFLQENTDKIEDALFIRISTGDFTGFYASITSSGLSVPSFINVEELDLGQGFFVRKKEQGSSTVQFKNSMRTSNQASFYRQSAKEPENYIRLGIEQNMERHETILLRDKNNAFKGLASLPSFNDYTTMLYSIDATNHKWLISQHNSDTVALGLQVNAVDSTSISLLKNPLQETLLLEDRFLNKWHAFSQNPTYRFVVSSTKEENRFFIHYIDTDVSEENITAYYQEETLHILFPNYLEEVPKIMIYDVLGRTVKSGGNVSFNGFQLTQPLSRVSSQMLLVRILVNGTSTPLKVMVK